MKSYFVNHPELRADLEGSILFSSLIIRVLFFVQLDVMIRLSLSTDTNIRSQLMAQIRAITSSNLLEISEKIKQILCERARDKIVCEYMRIISGEEFHFSFSSGKFEKKH